MVDVVASVPPHDVRDAWRLPCPIEHAYSVKAVATRTPQMSLVSGRNEETCMSVCWWGQWTAGVLSMRRRWSLLGGPLGCVADLGIGRVEDGSFRDAVAHMRNMNGACRPPSRIRVGHDVCPVHTFGNFVTDSAQLASDDCGGCCEGGYVNPSLVEGLKVNGSPHLRRRHHRARLRRCIGVRDVLPIMLVGSGTVLTVRGFQRITPMARASGAAKEDSWLLPRCPFAHGMLMTRRGSCHGRDTVWLPKRAGERRLSALGVLEGIPVVGLCSVRCQAQLGGGVSPPRTHLWRRSPSLSRSCRS